MDRPSDRALLVALNGAPGLSRAAICRLGAELAQWRDLGDRAAVQAAAERLSIPLDALEAGLASRRGAETTLAAESVALARLDGRIVTRLDPEYSPRLHDLPLPPPVLEIAGCGDLPGPGRTGPPAVAIVGSRRASAYGLEVARWLAEELAGQGVLVVSGFAKGIDAAAHEGALAANAGQTVGVLGCGLPFDYPKGHRDLAARIRVRGALVSEFPAALPPAPANFPVRNRIIAALAEIVVVVEAAARSGSLITARLALDLGREVLAVPGRISDEQALGTNDLLRDGAAPVTHPSDVLERLGIAEAARGGRPSATGRSAMSTLASAPPPALAALFGALPVEGELPVDRLASAAEIPVDRAFVDLLELELGGWAVRTPAGGYRRRGP